MRAESRDRAGRLAAASRTSGPAPGCQHVASARAAATGERARPSAWRGARGLGSDDRRIRQRRQAPSAPPRGARPAPAAHTRWRPRATFKQRTPARGRRRMAEPRRRAAARCAAQKQARHERGRHGARLRMARLRAEQAYRPAASRPRARASLGANGAHYRCRAGAALRRVRSRIAEAVGRRAAPRPIAMAIRQRRHGRRR